MSDIVRRLRSLNLWAQDDWKDTVSEAADEITRLQKEVETAREALEAVASIMPKYAMKGDTASDDEALDAVLETVTDALKGGRE